MREREREERLSMKTNRSEKSEVFLMNLQMETGAVPGMKMKHFDWIRLFSRAIVRVRICSTRCLLRVPVLRDMSAQASCVPLEVPLSLILGMLNT